MKKLKIFCIFILILFCSGCLDNSNEWKYVELQSKEYKLYAYKHNGVQYYDNGTIIIYEGKVYNCNKDGSPDLLIIWTLKDNSTKYCIY